MQGCPPTETFIAIFQKLIANGERNFNQQPQQIKHDIMLKNLLPLFLLTVDQEHI